MVCSAVMVSATAGSRAHSRVGRRGADRLAIVVVSVNAGLAAGVLFQSHSDLTTVAESRFASGLVRQYGLLHDNVLTTLTLIGAGAGGIIFAGQDAVASEGMVRATWAFVRRDGGWRIASYHNSPAS